MAVVGMTAADAHGRIVDLREPAVVCDPARMGSVWPTRHSFVASLLRHAVDQRWEVTLPVWEIDGEGRGQARYDVRAEGHLFHFLVFSQIIGEDERTDRVIAARWDTTAALVDGPLDDARVQAIHDQVSRQEDGRADAHTLVWTRANRSGRFFDLVTARLAAGLQPEADDFHGSPYILRSTAYYANGKFGMAPFSALSARGPLAVPYRAQMLSAWLLREFSCDLVEHIAATRSAEAVLLSPEWRRFIGIGNATGLGMVPFVVNHPAILDAWCRARELPLAAAVNADAAVAKQQAPDLALRLRDAASYFKQNADVGRAPFQGMRPLAEEMLRAADRVAGFLDQDRPWSALWRWADSELTPEAREAVASCLIDITDELDARVEASLTVSEVSPSTPRLRAHSLLEDIRERYRWALDAARKPGAAADFWYYSRESEEPRRGRHGVDAGEHVAMAVEIPAEIATLEEALDQQGPDDLVAELLLARPELRHAAHRVASTSCLPYGETHDDLSGESFLPLQLQRFQLATYGAGNYIPQSTDWVRVTFMQGAYSRRELAGLESWRHPLFPTSPDA